MIQHKSVCIHIYLLINKGLRKWRQACILSRQAIQGEWTKVEKNKLKIPWRDGQSDKTGWSYVMTIDNGLLRFSMEFTTAGFKKRVGDGSKVHADLRVFHISYELLICYLGHHDKHSYRVHHNPSETERVSDTKLTTQTTLCPSKNFNQTLKSREREEFECDLIFRQWQWEFI